MSEKNISFQYEGKPYVLKLNSYNLANALEVDYDRECRYKNDEDNTCDHDYGRCMVIENIQKEQFKYESFFRYNLESPQSSPEEIASLVKELAKACQNLSIEEYIDCHGESDYYGETLEKTISPNDLESIYQKFLNLLNSHSKLSKVQ